MNHLEMVFETSQSHFSILEWTLEEETGHQTMATFRFVVFQSIRAHLNVAPLKFALPKEILQDLLQGEITRAIALIVSSSASRTLFRLALKLANTFVTHRVAAWAKVYRSFSRDCQTYGTFQVCIWQGETRPWASF